MRATSMRCGGERALVCTAGEWAAFTAGSVTASSSGRQPTARHGFDDVSDLIGGWHAWQSERDGMTTG